MKRGVAGRLPAALAAALGLFLAWALLLPTAARAQDTAPDFGTATVANQSYALGSAITDLVLPEATGGNAPLTYALSPLPPAGLSFNAGTRTLSGTPSAGQAATTYTYTVTDSDNDTDSLTFTIAVSFGCAGSTAVGGSAVMSGGLVDDCEALLASEASLVGTGTALNWDTGTAMGSWNHVSLADSRVTQLDLFEKSLAGSIPAALGNLSSLTKLYLDGNSLTGSIPAALGNLSSLERLDLQDNALTGSIPTQLGNFSSSLWAMQLQRNSLTGPIPSAFGNLTGLTHLFLQDNSLTGTIPAQLGNLSVLLVLQLAGNALTGSIPPALGDLSNLGTLDLAGNSLTGSIPEELGDLSMLTSLRLEENSLTGSIPPELGNLSSLTTLVLNANSLTGSIPAELGNLTELTYLLLQGNSLTGSIPPELGGLSSLTSLRLDTNQLTGCMPAGLRAPAGGSFWINPQFNNLRNSLVNLPVCPGMPILMLTPGDGAITASWTVPAGGTPTGYDLEHKLASASAWTDAGHAGTETTATVGSLTNGSEYELRVRAKTATDTGDWSAVAMATPTATPASTVTGPDFGAATVANQSYAPNTAITDLVLPEATGGNGTLAYALSPSPPTGLTFDPDTRTLSGTPTGGQASTIYTYSVTDADGNADWLTFTIAVSFGCAGSTAVGGSAVTSGGLVDDCEALLASEATLVGAGTPILNWATDEAMSSWTGVSLSGGGSDRRVAHLLLQDKQLAGSIPPELGDLSGLTALYLYRNSLTGSIPAELRNLASLTQLSLEQNLLTGCIPQALQSFASTINPQKDSVDLPVCSNLARVPSVTLGAPAANPTGGLTVSRRAPANSGPAITGYDVQYRLAGASSWTSHPHAGAGTSTTITGLENGATYEVQVRAKNADGTGPWSLPVRRAVGPAGAGQGSSADEPTPRDPLPLQLALWTDRPGYRAGETVRLYLSLEPHDDRGRYRTFVYLEQAGGGERRWLSPLGADGRLRDEAVDAGGLPARVSVPRQLDAADRELGWEGPAPGPGLWQFVLELRPGGPDERFEGSEGPFGTRRAWAKFTVAERSLLLNRRGFDREVRDELTLRNDTLYFLGHQLFVRAGATLTIEPGTVVQAFGRQAAIIVEPGGRLVAEGTLQAPAVLTCSAPAGWREPGCWGGLRILGRAPVTRLQGTAPGVLPAERAAYGGEDAEDSSGTLRFVRVEFAGASGDPETAVPAIGLYGAGSGTVLDHVQARDSLGDGFAFHGGAAVCDHCVASGSGGAGLSWQRGWQGEASHVYVQHGRGGDHGLSGRHDPEGHDREPRSLPILSNVTLVHTDPYTRRGRRAVALGLSDGGGIRVVDLLATRFGGGAIRAIGRSRLLFGEGESSVRGAMLWLNGSPQVPGGLTAALRFDVRNPRLRDVRDFPNPDPRPKADSPALSRAREGYIGAFGPKENWLEGWTVFGPESAYDLRNAEDSP